MPAVLRDMHEKISWIQNKADTSCRYYVEQRTETTDHPQHISTHDHNNPQDIEKHINRKKRAHAFKRCGITS
jgi:hypothetical protein